MRPFHLPEPPRRLLLIKPSALGDVVHALPVAYLLKRRWPACELSWVVASGFADLLDGHRLVDRVIRFERRPAGGWGVTRVVELARSLREGRFDLVIDLQGLFRSGWMTLATGAAVRVGFAEAREGAALAYTHPVRGGPVERHAVERYLDVCERLGCGREPVVFDFDLKPGDRTRAEALIGQVGRFAAILPGTNWASKRWPVERFAALVGPLREMGLSSVVLGARGDGRLAAGLAGAIDLTGRTSVRGLVAVLERASVVITNDSGPMHIAAALRRPVVSVFGPTSDVRTGPFQARRGVIRSSVVCAPCFQRSCVHHSCMLHVGPADVLRRVSQLLAGQLSDGRSKASTGSPSAARS